MLFLEGDRRCGEIPEIVGLGYDLYNWSSRVKGEYVEMSHIAVSSKYALSDR
jgi:hypothetical protein